MGAMLATVDPALLDLRTITFWPASHFLSTRHINLPAAAYADGSTDWHHCRQPTPGEFSRGKLVHPDRNCHDSFGAAAKYFDNRHFASSITCLQGDWKSKLCTMKSSAIYNSVNCPYKRYISSALLAMDSVCHVVRGAASADSLDSEPTFHS